jgi:hypothetical protein
VKAVANGKNGGQLTSGRTEGRQDAPVSVAKARAAK